MKDFSNIETHIKIDSTFKVLKLNLIPVDVLLMCKQYLICYQIFKIFIKLHLSRKIYYLFQNLSSQATLLIPVRATLTPTVL